MDIALFGGTFDPIHNAHLAVARAARDRLGLSRILVIPAAVPPHKHARKPEPWNHRFRMIELACAGDPALIPSDLERGTEHSYSIDTIERVRAVEPPDTSIFFLIGADAFADIATWRRWRDVVKAVQFVVVSRPGHGFDLPEGARVHTLDDVSMPVSSSAIREKLARCEPPDELPPAVFDYIRQNELYAYGSACRAQEL